MKVQAIGYQNYRPNFSAVYQPANIKWAEEQKPIVIAISKVMKTPLKKFNGQSAQDFYKLNENIDFLLENQSNNSVLSVLLKGLKNMRSKLTNNKNIIRDIREENSFIIGSYNNNSKPFNIDDIEYAYKNI